MSIRLLLTLCPLLIVAPLATQSRTSAKTSRLITPREQPRGSTSAQPKWEYATYTEFPTAGAHEFRWTAGTQDVAAMEFKTLVSRLGGKFENLSFQRVNDIANIVGAQGWELVNCELFNDQGAHEMDDLFHECYFKRRKQ